MIERTVFVCPPGTVSSVSKVEPLTPSGGHADEHAYADRKRQREQRTAFGLRGNPFKGVITNLSADPCRLVAEARSLVGGKLLTAAEAIQDIVEDWSDRLRKLRAGGRCGRGSAVACGFSDSAELLLDGAQLFGYRVEARIKSAWAVLKQRLLRARG